MGIKNKMMNKIEEKLIDLVRGDISVGDKIDILNLIKLNKGIRSKYLDYLNLKDIMSDGDFEDHISMVETSLERFKKLKNRSDSPFDSFKKKSNLKIVFAGIESIGQGSINSNYMNMLSSEKLSLIKKIKTYRDKHENKEEDIFSQYKTESKLFLQN